MQGERKNTYVKDSKFAFYRSDGQGRDTYILYNNGGTVIPRRFASSVDNLTKKYKVANTKHGHIKPSNTNTWAKVSFYRPDGSGRDTYIKDNEGGFLQGAQR